MRSGVWLWLAVGGSLLSCAGGYPLEPTPCDEYCHATKDLQCQYYSPAACVVTCEEQNTASEACLAQLRAVASCFHDTPGAVKSYCSFGGYYGPEQPPALPCAEELALLQACTFLDRVEDVSSEQPPSTP